MEAKKIHSWGSYNFLLSPLWYIHLYIISKFRAFLFVKIILQMGQSLEAFKQWKSFVILLFSCVEAVSSKFRSSSSLLMNDDVKVENLTKLCICLLIFDFLFLCYICSLWNIHATMLLLYRHKLLIAMTYWPILIN